MTWYAFLLAPFALIFQVISDVRNLLFDLRILKSYKSSIPSLIIGNLSVGGTGKTPMVEFLIRNLGNDKAVASLSRGYGRKTKGFLKASTQSTPSEIGDEPLQIFLKFQEKIPVFVGEDRVAALEKIAQIESKTGVVILDDAFQHRKLQGDFYCLLTPFETPFYKDFLLPMGRLRESRKGAKRADMVVVTKCPENLSESQRAEKLFGLEPYIKKSAPVFFSQIGYGDPYPLDHETSFCENVILVSGLANDQPFLDYCAQKYAVMEVLSFPDHHEYGAKDGNRILTLMQKHKAQSPVLLTTEKDAVKLKSLEDQGFLGEIPIFVLPIEAKFDQEDKEMLLNYIRRKFKKQ